MISAVGKKRKSRTLAQCHLGLLRSQETGSVNGPELKLLQTEG